MAKANSRGMLPNGRKKAGPAFTKALHAITDQPDYKAVSKQTRVDPQAYLCAVLERLPTTKYAIIDRLLPHNWKPPVKV
jgi:hypothetical protein